MMLKDWLQERYDNSVRIAQGKTAADQAGWLEDAAYLLQACVAAQVCGEIQAIMRVYREQEASRNGVGTPGGLEHMGDVWTLLSKWDERLQEP